MYKGFWIISEKNITNKLWSNKMINRLVKIANMLDDMGMYSEADTLTNTTKKLLPDDFESVELSKANLAEAVAQQVMDYFNKTSNADFLSEYADSLTNCSSKDSFDLLSDALFFLIFSMAISSTNLVNVLRVGAV